MSSAGRLEMKMDVNGAIVELSEILRAIRGKEEMSWLMVDLWAIQDPHVTFPVSDIEDEIERSPHGLGLTRSELESISDQLAQCVDCELLGFEGEKPCSESPDIKIVAFDGIRWIIDFRSVDRARLEELERLTAGWSVGIFEKYDSYGDIPSRFTSLVTPEILDGK